MTPQKNPDDAYIHGELRTDMRWLKDQTEDQSRRLTTVESSINEIRLSLATRTPLIDVAAVSAAQSAASKVESLEEKRVKPIEDKVAALERKNAITGVVVAFILALLGLKFSGVPWPL